jgi:hypothetical protein
MHRHSPVTVGIINFNVESQEYNNFFLRKKENRAKGYPAQMEYGLSKRGTVR